MPPTNAGQVQRAQSNLQRGSYGAQGERLQWSYYDSEKLATGTLEHRFFTQGVGKPFTVGGNKNLSDSNVISDGIPQGQRFVVKAISAFYKPHADFTEVIMNLLTQALINSTLTMKITGKDSVFQVNLLELFGNNFPIQVVPATAADNYYYTGTSIIRASYPLNVPIVLSALTRFEGLVEHHVAINTALDDDKLMISLQGVLERLA